MTLRFFKGQSRSSDAYLKVVPYLDLITDIQRYFTENVMLYSFFAQLSCLTALLLGKIPVILYGPKPKSPSEIDSDYPSSSNRGGHLASI